MERRRREARRGERLGFAPDGEARTGGCPRQGCRGRHGGPRGRYRRGQEVCLMSAFTHLDDEGHARMVDVTAKVPTVRTAVAEGFVECAPHVVAALRDGSVPKGDVLAVARIAGIAGAK